VVALGLVIVAGRKLAETSWPLSRGEPGLLAAAGALFLVAYALKIYAWHRLFAADERPHPLALATANGGASVLGVALPARLADALRVAIVRRYPGCPAGVRTLCLSLVMLGLIDTAALAPLAVAASALPGHAIGVRAGLVVVAATGIGAAALVVALPRCTGSRQLLRFRLARWLQPRTTPLSDATRAWALICVYWIVRAVALLLLLGTFGIGFSFALAILFLCAGAVAGALPIGPAAAATQGGAGAAVLIASGVGASQAIDVAVAGQALGVLAGGAILIFVALWRTRAGWRWIQSHGVFAREYVTPRLPRRRRALA
jgi:lysylphosphatidylglycerol synthase-like protein